MQGTNRSYAPNAIAIILMRSNLQGELSVNEKKLWLRVLVFRALSSAVSFSSEVLVFCVLNDNPLTVFSMSAEVFPVTYCKEKINLFCDKGYYTLSTVEKQSGLVRLEALYMQKKI